MIRWLTVVLLFAGNETIAQPLRAISKISHYQLPNGLQVMLREDRLLPLVGFDICYNVGPANEPVGRSGLAHLVEHMMFEGTTHIRLAEQSQFFTSIGGGQEGGTSYDRTGYHAYGPSNHLEELLWNESDRMGFLAPALSAERLENAKQVVRNERRLQFENRPYSATDEKLVQLLFPEPHPYHGNIIGPHEEIEAASLEEVRQFIKAYYVPNNASIVLDGDFSESEARALINKYFGSLPKAEKIPRPLPLPPREPTSEIRETVYEPVQLSRISVGWVGPSAYAEGDAELDLLTSILGGGKTGLLYRDLVRKSEVAHDVGCTYTRSLQSFLKCDVTVKPGVAVDTVEGAMWGVLEKIAKVGPTAVDLQRAKARAKAQLVRKFEDIVQRVHWINTYFYYTKDPLFAERQAARYDGATVESIRQFTRKYLDSHRRVVVRTLPRESASAK